VVSINILGLEYNPVVYNSSIVSYIGIDAILVIVQLTNKLIRSSGFRLSPPFTPIRVRK